MYKIGDFVTINNNPYLFNGRLVVTKSGQGLTGQLINKRGNVWCIKLGVFPEIQWVYYTEQDFDPAAEKDNLPNIADPKLIHLGV